MKVLDTDTCVEILRGNERVLTRRAATTEALVTTWINVAELHYGCSRSNRPDENRALLAALLTTLPVLGFGAPSVRIFGDAKALLRRAGRPQADADLLIASLAVAANAVLVTGNVAHFRDFPGLTTEDWIRG